MNRSKILYGIEGFSLIESLVIVSIMGILTGLALQAFPSVRAHQQLVADTEQIRSLLLDAKQRTLNQVRPEDCKPIPGDQESKERASCSDVGISFQDGEIVQFADTTEDNVYSFSDYSVVKMPLSTKVKNTSTAFTLLFKSTPPSLDFYVDGRLIGEGETRTIILQADNGTERTLTIHPFGTIDVQDNG